MLKTIKSTLKRMLPLEELRSLMSTRKNEGTGKFFRANFLGHDLAVYDADKTSGTWYQAGWASENRLEFIELGTHHIPEDATIFDIGAHQGVVSILLKRIFAPAGHVVAVELDELNYAACLKNFEENQDQGITAIHAAAAEKPGWVRHSGRSNSEVLNSAKLPFLLQKVRAVTLEELGNEYGMPDLIYMDIEGAEVLAIKGAGKALGKVPVWFIEMHGDEQCSKFGGSNDTILKKFRDAGYALKYAADETEPFETLGTGAAITKRGFLIAYKSSSRSRDAARAQI